MLKIGLLALALSFAQAQPVQPAPEPVRFTVAASGDFLIHTPVAARALALGGGSTYDFAPLFDPVKRHIAGADLALCHVETPLVPGPVQGYPSFRTPPGLARSIKKVGWDACSTASNHTLDAGQYGVGTTLRALDRAGIPHLGSARSAAESRRIPMLDVRGPQGRLPRLHEHLERPGGPSPVERQLGEPGPHPERRAPSTPPRRRPGDREPALGRRVRPRDHVRAGRARRPAHEVAGDRRDRRPACARGAADPEGQRQAGRVRRGQPRLEPDRRLLPGGVAVRADRADRFRRAARASVRGRAASATCRPGSAIRTTAYCPRSPGRPPGAAPSASPEGGRESGRCVHNACETEVV